MEDVAGRNGAAGRVDSNDQGRDLLVIGRFFQGFPETIDGGWFLPESDRSLFLIRNDAAYVDDENFPVSLSIDDTLLERLGFRQQRDRHGAAVE